ncbi:MAG: CHAT domain-containing tetratricopeptide repeat protein [Actinomycetota bacterium]
MPRPDRHPDAAEMAQAAYESATRDPEGSRLLAEGAEVLARAQHNAAAHSVARQAMGIAARSLGRNDEAVAHLRRGVSIALHAGLDRQAARCRVSLAPALHLSGSTRRAISTLDQATQSLDGQDRAQALTQQAMLQFVVGDLDAALSSLRRAIPVLRREGEQIWQARALTTRGVVRTRLGQFTTADADFAEAHRMFTSAGDAPDAAGALHNRGWAAAYRGDVPAALEHYDAAEVALTEAGIPTGALPLDRVQLLLFAGLAEEAWTLAESTASALAASGLHGSRADALLIASAAALAAGDTAAALGRAEDARIGFRRLGRSGWTALAGYAAVRARWGAGDYSARAFRLARRTAQELEAARLAGPALDSRLIAGRTALALGRKPAAFSELTAVAAARRRGTAEQRSRGWLAEALLRTEKGKTASAVRALRAGLDIIDRHRATLGATELRAHASNHGTDLATLGQRLAIESGRPAVILEWTERWRGAALRLAPVRPPDDRELATDLASLRSVHTDLAKAAAEGRPTSALARRRTTLEESVLRRTRRTSGSVSDSNRIATSHELAEVLGEHALVEIAAVDDRIYGVALVEGRLSLHALGDVPTVVKELDASRFALRRLAFQRGSRASVAAARAGIAHSGSRLEGLLIAPMLGFVGDRPLVIIPPGGLHTLAWSTLPSCASRAITIAPSATTWLRCARSRPPRGKRVALVAGPGLPGADDEVAALRELHPTATLLTGQAATAKAVCKAIDGAELAHIAAHGTFLGDNPLFSSLSMIDGPMTVYDLELLRRAPYRIVLSSYDSGLAGVRAGDELMGLAAALFPLGTSGIVASVVPVPDEATRPLMTALHRRVVAGDSLSQALASARSTLDLDDPVQYAAGAAFVALGAQ